MAISAIVQAQANKLLNVTLGTTTWTGTGAPSPPMTLNLTTTAPTATSAGTPLSGTGSSVASITFNSASSGQATGPTSVISWTNGSGSNWSIVGAEIWDTAGSPVRWWFGTWAGEPITVSPSATFQVNVGGCTVQLG